MCPFPACGTNMGGSILQIPLYVLGAGVVGIAIGWLIQ